ncbi:MAG: ribulose 1,5-bisphosphate carboxylase [Limnohabitans sp.]|nr:ribulose 1,5-bisphosphate carboxylase [Limnohabitans sp.]
MNERITAVYRLSTSGDPERTAALIAGEQSSGTFVAIPGEDEALKARAAATYGIQALDDLTDQAQLRHYRLTLSWPLANLGPSLPNLMATVAGNLYELRQVSQLRLLDFEMPPAFADAYPGPAFGISGTRALTGVPQAPLIGTIIKPSVGLSAADTAAMVDQLCAAGIDFIKDDELQADGPACPFDERVRLCMKVIRSHAGRSGRKVMYAFNLTGELDEMRRRHDLVLAEGGTAVMLSLNSVGMSGLNAFRRHTQLPIHAHRNGWGYLQAGWSYVAWQKLWRLAGVDHMHVNGIANKFQEDDDSVIASARACLQPLFNHKPCVVMPVFSSGQTVMQAEATWQRLQSPDLIYLAGGGLFAHPDGIAAGVNALRQAWDAAMAGVPLATAAQTHRELREAVSTFGSHS